MINSHIDKIASYLTTAIEAGIGAGLGAGGAYLASEDNRRRNMLIGGASGALAGAGIGKLMRNRQLRNLSVKDYENVLKTQSETIANAHSNLMAGAAKANTNIFTGGQSFDTHVAPHLNTILSGKHQRASIQEGVDILGDKINHRPFAIGARGIRNKFRQEAQLYTKPYGTNHLRLDEDVTKLTNRQKRAITKKLQSPTATEDRVVTQLVDTLTR